MIPTHATDVLAPVEHIRPCGCILLGRQRRNVAHLHGGQVNRAFGASKPVRDDHEKKPYVMKIRKPAPKAMTRMVLRSVEVSIMQSE